MTKGFLAATALFALAGVTIAASGERGTVPPRCRVQGLWERVATIQAGKRAEFRGARQLKMLTANNYMWLAGELRRDTLPLRTVADTARYYGMSGGAGTYRIVGNKYTERLTLFVDPKFEGRDFTSSCRVQGNTWYHSFLARDLGDTTAAGRDTTTEVWRRIE